MAPATRLLSAIVLTGLLILTAMGYLQAAAPTHARSGAVERAVTITAPGERAAATSADKAATLDVEAVSRPNGQSARRHADGGKPAPIRQLEKPPLSRTPPTAGETVTASYRPAGTNVPTRLVERL